MTEVRASREEQLLLIGVSKDDEIALTDALSRLGRSARFVCAGDEASAGELLREKPVVTGVLVDLNRIQGPAGFWLKLLEAHGVAAPLFVLASEAQEALVGEWMGAGAQGCVFRPEFLGLVSMLSGNTPAPAGPQHEQGGKAGRRPGTELRLMLVDDHASMARVSARLLETLGYRTSVFENPLEALAAFRERPMDFDAVLTDLSMPQMSGEEFTRSLKAVRSDVPIIVSSGMASAFTPHELERLGFSAVLEKPWRLEQAMATLQKVLRPPRCG